MGLILKNSVVEGLGPRAVRFNLSDVRAEAAAILRRSCDQLDRAEKEAAAILEKARAEGEAIKQRAREEGFRAGQAEGMAEGTKIGRAEALEQGRKEYAGQNAALRTGLEKTLAAFESERNHLMAQAHQDLLALALAMAVKITRRRLAIEPAMVLDNVKSAVNLVGSRSVVEIRVNPEDVDRFELMDPDQAHSLLGLQSITIVKDAAVETGGCVVTTLNGKIDAQVSTQLQNLIRQMAPAMAEAVKAWSSDAEPQT
jgi:flagellar assembly protein FliH